MPHRVVLNGILELPFGHGRQLGQQLERLPERDRRRLERLGDLAVADAAGR